MIDEKQRLTPEKVQALKEEHNFKLVRGSDTYLATPEDDQPRGCYVGILMHTRYQLSEGANPLNMTTFTNDEGEDCILSVEDRRGRYLGETGDYALYLSCLELGFEDIKEELDPWKLDVQLRIFQSEAEEVAKLGYADGKAGRALADVDHRKEASIAVAATVATGVAMDCIEEAGPVEEEVVGVQ